MKNVFDGTHFVNEIVVVDDTKFVNCSFDGCTIRYSGGPWSLNHCTFSPDTKLTFTGQAYLTMALLNELGMIKPSVFADPSQITPKRVN